MTTDEIRLLIISGALVLAAVAAARRLGRLVRSASTKRIEDLDDASVAMDYAEEYLERHRLTEAVLCARRAIRLAPKDPRTHAMMARVHRARGNGAKAKKEEQRARELDGEVKPKES